MERNSCDSWKITKYKELKRTDRNIVKDIILMHDPTRRTLCVYWNGGEIDRVFYHMEVSRFPVFKFKENHFFVYFNESGQGFRLTFESTSERMMFYKVMQKLAYISESPLKTMSQTQNEDQWGAWPSSISSQSMSQSSSRADARPSAKRLSQLCMSQPVRNPYEAPPPMPMSQPVMPIHDPFDDFDRRTIGSSLSSFSISSSVNSTYSGITGTQKSNFTSSPGMSEQNVLRDSQLSAESLHPFTPPMPPVLPPQKVDKSCQTDSLADILSGDKTAMLEHIKYLMENSEFIEMVKTVRNNMNQINRYNIEEFKDRVKETTDVKNLTDLDSPSNRTRYNNSQSIASTAPDFTQQTSEKEELTSLQRSNRNPRNDFRDPNEPSCSYSTFTQPATRSTQEVNKRASEVEEPDNSRRPKFRRLVDKFVHSQR